MAVPPSLSPWAEQKHLLAHRSCSLPLRRDLLLLLQLLSQTRGGEGQEQDVLLSPCADSEYSPFAAFSEHL